MILCRRKSSQTQISTYIQCTNTGKEDIVVLASSQTLYLFILKVYFLVHSHTSFWLHEIGLGKIQAWLLVVLSLAPIGRFNFFKNKTWLFLVEVYMFCPRLSKSQLIGSFEIFLSVLFLPLFNHVQFIQEIITFSYVSLWYPWFSCVICRSRIDSGKGFI